MDLDGGGHGLQVITASSITSGDGGHNQAGEDGMKSSPSSITEMLYEHVAVAPIGLVVVAPLAEITTPLCVVGRHLTS
jgi:hypothetical protein